MSRRWALPGRTVLLTGAAGGIGSETARRLARRGANVALLDIDIEGLKRLADELGDRGAWFACDITSWEDLEAAVAGSVERFGRIDAVIANAGVVAVGSVETMDPTVFEHVLDVDLLGTWRTIRTSLPQLLEQHGYVLFVSSLAGDVQGPLHAAYNAGKAGLQALANTLRIEVQGRGVDVGIAHLLYTDTARGRWAVEHPMMKQLAGLRQMKPRSVERTADDLVRGIERRARRVFAPPAARVGVMAPDFLRKRVEGLARRKGWAETIRETDAEG
jgi:NAD(P)-dependent dehydrogenase (short-subunit alcohol dehydrogenase family)